jgi:hypothetical protein
MYSETFIWLGTWSVLEVYLSIISVCMPDIRAFFNYTSHRMRSKCSKYSALSRSPAASDGSRNAGPNEFIPAPREVTSGTFQSANREQGEFIRLQEIHSGKT